MVGLDSQSSLGKDAPVADGNHPHPAVLLPNASYMAFASFEQVGFDLVITNSEGEVFVVHDYFSFDPPPNLMLESGAGLSPEMIANLLPGYAGENVMFAGPASTQAATGEAIGTVKVKIGDVDVERGGQRIDLQRGDEVMQGDRIITGARGFVRIEMNDGTKFTLGRNGDATLDTFHYDKAADVYRDDGSVDNYAAGSASDSDLIARILGTESIDLANIEDLHVQDGDDHGEQIEVRDVLQMPDSVLDGLLPVAASPGPVVGQALVYDLLADSGIAAPAPSFELRLHAGELDPLT